jgi:hypothetical protein
LEQFSRSLEQFALEQFSSGWSNLLWSNSSRPTDDHTPAMKYSLMTADYD